MSSTTNDPAAIQKEIRGYYVIFAGLVILSLTAVGISYLHLPLVWSIFFTLSIAGVQVFLAAGYFMHLISEKSVLVNFVLAMTGGFFIAVLALPLMEHKNPITGTTHYIEHKTSAPIQEHGSVHSEEHVP